MIDMDKNTHIICYYEGGKARFFECGGYVQHMGEELAIKTATDLAKEKPGLQVFVLRAVVRVGPSTSITITRL